MTFIRLTAILVYVFAFMLMLKSFSDLMTGRTAEAGHIALSAGLLCLALVAGIGAWLVDRRICRAASK